MIILLNPLPKMIKFLIYLVLIACGAYLLSHLTKKTKFLIYLVATLIYLVWASPPPPPPHPQGGGYLSLLKYQLGYITRKSK